MVGKDWIKMIKDTKETVIQTQDSTQSSTTIAGQIIEIFERNKLTIAQSKQILIDVENVLNSQRVHSNIQNIELSTYNAPQTLGIVEYTIKG